MKSHKPQLILEANIFRSDGTLKEIRRIQPPPEAEDELRIEIRKRNGKFVSSNSFPVRSFLQNWAAAMYARFANTAGNIVKTDGNGMSEEPTYSDVNAPAGNDDYGIWIGTDDGSILALAPANYTLGGKIDHGNEAGQLNYALTEHVPVAESGTDRVYKITRTFTNNSGDTITAKEVGLVASYKLYWMICRDLLDSEEVPINAVIADSEIASVIYTWTITQASGFVKNYLLSIESCQQNQSVTYKDVDGNDYGLDFGYYADCWRTDASSTIDSYGIVCGTDSSALDVDDYALGSKIAHGSGEGQLAYAVQEFEDISVDGDDVLFTLKRIFQNFSGTTITIQEVGIHCLGRGGHYWLAARTLTGGLALEDGELVQFRYSFKHTV